jgi:hypothetical protein
MAHLVNRDLVPPAQMVPPSHPSAIPRTTGLTTPTIPPAARGSTTVSTVDGGCVRDLAEEMTGKGIPLLTQVTAPFVRCATVGPTNGLHPPGLAASRVRFSVLVAAHRTNESAPGAVSMIMGLLTAAATNPLPPRAWLSGCRGAFPWGTRPGERAAANLKTWKLLTNLRCLPRHATTIIAAVASHQTLLRGDQTCRG